MQQLARPLLALLLLLPASCSDDGDGGGGGGGGTSAPSTMAGFTDFCTGTLKIARQGMTSEGPGAWAYTSTNPINLPAGTEFLLGASGDRFEGYLFLANGAPSKIRADFSTGLIKDTDFTTSCPAKADNDFVLLVKSTFYPNEDLSGQPCTLEAGTAFTSHGFVGGGSDKPAQVSSDKIKAICGLDKSYSPDIVYGRLLKK